MAKKSKANTGLIVHVVLDRSGSMELVRDDTIGGFNAYVDQLRASTPDATLSLTQFGGSDTRLVIDNAPIAEVAKLTHSTYVPRGGTPLYDAIGHVIAALDEKVGDAKAIVILTDGYENMSKEHSKESIKKMLDDRQDNKGWLVIYLGADQDAFAEGSKFGSKFANTMTFDKSKMGVTLGVAASATARYYAAGAGFAGQNAAEFTEDERKEAE